MCLLLLLWGIQQLTKQSPHPHGQAMWLGSPMQPSRKWCIGKWLRCTCALYILSSVPTGCQWDIRRRLYPRCRPSVSLDLSMTLGTVSHPPSQQKCLHQTLTWTTYKLLLYWLLNFESLYITAFIDPCLLYSLNPTQPHPARWTPLRLSLGLLQGNLLITLPLHSPD